PEILAHKEEVLRKEKPVCALERVRLDLSDVQARRELFLQLGRGANRVLVVTEGLLVYLTAEEAAALGNDLAAQPAFEHWIIDVVSPALFNVLARNIARHLTHT